MTPLAPESPADEYERRLAERREKARRTIARYAKWWLGGQVLTVVLGLTGAVLVFLIESAPSGDRDALGWAAMGLFIGFAVAGVFTFEVSIVVAVVALRDWSLLPRRWVCTAAAIWFSVVSEILGWYLVAEIF